MSDLHNEARRLFITGHAANQRELLAFLCSNCNRPLVEFREATEGGEVRLVWCANCKDVPVWLDFTHDPFPVRLMDEAHADIHRLNIKCSDLQEKLDAARFGLMFWRACCVTILAVVIFVYLVACEPVPTDPTPIRTADGVPVQVGERYYRTGLVAVTRSPEDERPGVHQVRFWSSIVVGELEQREGVWFAVDTRFMDSTGTIISEPVLELWASKDKMQVSIGPELFR